MSVLEVVNYGHPILRNKCQFVSDFSKLSTFIEDMFDSFATICAQLYSRILSYPILMRSPTEDAPLLFPSTVGAVAL